MEPKTKKTNQIFKIIDSVLKQVFGEEATSFIYKYIEQNYSLPKNKFSNNIDAFAKGLEECLSSGALVIENKILEDLAAVYGAPNKVKFEGQYDFANQMKLLTQRA
ncbi:MAG: hypothetical protein WHU54_00570 [Candidatus Bathyarchaeia archaeon]